MFARTWRVATPAAKSGARYLQTKPLRPWNSHRLTPPSAMPRSDLKEPLGQTPQPQQTSHQAPQQSAGATKITSSNDTQPSRPKRRPLKPLKAAITLTPKAVEHLQRLLDSPQPKLIRIGVRNRGCSGLTYNLEYVDRPGKFDEEIVQDGVRVLIDSKALFSVIGSQMDWVDDKLTSRFVFNNPNSKGECGCGESFMV